MRFITLTIFAVAGRLVLLATAKPIPNWNAGGIAIPLTRHSSILNSNESIDLDAITSHGIYVREKVLAGLANYEKNTGTMHPFAVTRSESGLGRRGASLPLAHGENALYWIGEISIGTPAKTLRVQIDTGTAILWVLETGCSGVSADRDLWDPRSSASAKYRAVPFQREYLDGTLAKGTEYTDNVTIAGFTADPQTFGSVTSFTSPLEKEDVDGLLGLAFPSLSESESGSLPLFESLVRQRKVINPTFSLKLAPSGAEMYVGGANSMLYNGDITYTRVTVPGYWQVSMNDVRLNGDRILENLPVVLDTGATYIFGDWNRVAELYRRIGGTLVVHRGFAYYHLPCDSFPTLSLTFGGRTFDIPPEALRLNPMFEGSPDCFCAILGLSRPVAFWVIGMTFLQRVYTVFDYGTLQVGFADLA